MLELGFAMNIARILSVLLISFLVAAAAPTPDKKTAPNTDKSKLQGDWLFVRGEIAGHEVDMKHIRHMTFDGDRLILPEGGPGTRSFSLDTAKTLPQIPFIVKSDGRIWKINGIYSLDGNKLKLCYTNQADGERPDKFETKKGSRVQMFVLQRRKT